MKRPQSSASTQTGSARCRMNLDAARGCGRDQPTDQPLHEPTPGARLDLDLDARGPRHVEDRQPGRGARPERTADWAVTSPESEVSTASSASTARRS